MAPVLLAVLSALAAAAPGDGVRVAHAPLPSHPASALLPQVVPSPPDVVVRAAPRYGEVTLDHRKHLSLKASCRECHDTFPVGPIAFTPQTAHRACIGCHKERDAGPTACAGCHAGRRGPEAAVARAEPPPAAAEPADEAAPALGPGPLVVTLIGPPSYQSVELGYAAGGGSGPSLRVSSRRGRLAVTYSFERVARDGDSRLLGLLGAGVSHEVRDRLSVVGLALGGFDAIESPAVAVLPAVALRAGVEWCPGRGRRDSLQLGVTGVVDLAHAHAFGREVGGATFYATFGVGVAVRSLPPLAPR
jgi:hypothetical protein